MKVFLKDTYIKPFFVNGFYGKIIGVLFWFISLLILLSFIYGFIYIIDNVFVSTYESKMVVVNKKIKPAHYTTTYVKSGDVYFPINTFHDEEYYLYLKYKNEINDLKVDNIKYLETNLKDTVTCNYNYGRLTKDIYLNFVK